MIESDTKIENGSQLGIIFTLFLIMRLSFISLFSTGGLFASFQSTDYSHYYSTASLSEQGYFPFINMWFEYFPILTYIPQLAYKLVRLSLPLGDLESFSYLLFTRILQVLLLPFDAGILLLIYYIGRNIWGIKIANHIGWVYISLSVPLYYWTFCHQSVLVFFILLSIALFINKRNIPSAISLGLGIATKLSPIFLFAPVVKFLWPNRKDILTYILIAITITALVFTPFIILGGGKYVLASFASIYNLSSYRTIWAMIDGNWSPGDVGPLTSRLDLSQAYKIWGNPPVIHPLISFVLFAIIYGLVYFRKIKNNPLNMIWFVTLTATIFHLWLKGWSPQWATLFIPLYLLSFPNKLGLTLILILTGTVFLEWPLGTIFNSHGMLTLSIIGRTVLFIYVAILTSDRLNLIPERLKDFFRLKFRITE